MRRREDELAQLQKKINALASVFAEWRVKKAIRKAKGK
jgi:hypothetical protein